MDRYIRSASFNMIHLCIDKYDEYRMKGRAYNNTIKDVIEFNDIQDLFLKLDNIFDENGNPFSSEEKRSFKKEVSKEMIYQNKPQITQDYYEFLDVKGKLGCVDFVVKTRLYSNWQGIIFYKGEQQKFDDVVELIEKVTLFLQL